jgi:hypothetical protein
MIEKAEKAAEAAPGPERGKPKQSRFSAARRASSLVSNFAAERRPGSSIENLFELLQRFGGDHRHRR